MKQLNALGLAFLALSATPASAGIIQEGLIGWWSGSGNAADSSSLHNNGSYSGQYVAGRLGNDLAFNLATGKVRIHDIQAYDYQQYPGFTIGFWYNFVSVPNGSNGTFLGQDMGAGELPKLFIDYGYGHAGAFEIHLNNYGSSPRVFLPATNVPISSGWNQFTLVKDIDGFSFWLNGNAIGKAAYKGIIPNPQADLVFGYSEPCCQYGGYLQDVVIYNRPLSAREVTIVASDGPISVPSPGTAWLCGIGLVAMGLYSKGRRDSVGAIG